MKKILLLNMIALLISPSFLLAETRNDSLEAELSAELNNLSKSLPKKKQTAAAADVNTDIADPSYSDVKRQDVEPVVIKRKERSRVDAETIYVSSPEAQNYQQQQFEQIEKMPDTQVEATPLKESQADRLRKQRQGLELETEAKIVEKLESDRMESEKERMERLFGDRWKREEQAPAEQNIQVVPMVDNTNKELEYQELKNELRDMITEVKAKPVYEEEVEEPVYNFYVSGHMGTGTYQGTDNTSGVYSIGVTGGYAFDRNASFEVSFLRSSYDIEEYNLGGGYDPYSSYYGSSYYDVPTVTMDQTNILGAIKYSFLPDYKLRPYVGLAASYTLRNYSQESLYYGNQDYVIEDDSTSYDMGVQAGLDVKLSERFGFGLDMKYMKNITSSVKRNQNSYYYTFSQENSKAVEHINYMLVNLSATVYF